MSLYFCYPFLHNFRIIIGIPVYGVYIVISPKDLSMKNSSTNIGRKEILRNPGRNIFFVQKNNFRKQELPT
jgi:hypothetical protein